MAKREINIYHRADGRWEGRCYVKGNPFRYALQAFASIRNTIRFFPLFSLVVNRLSTVKSTDFSVIWHHLTIIDD